MGFVISIATASPRLDRTISTTRITRRSRAPIAKLPRRDPRVRVNLQATISSEAALSNSLGCYRLRTPTCVWERSRYSPTARSGPRPPILKKITAARIIAAFLPCRRKNWRVSFVWPRGFACRFNPRHRRRGDRYRPARPFANKQALGLEAASFTPRSPTKSS